MADRSRYMKKRRSEKSNSSETDSFARPDDRDKELSEQLDEDDDDEDDDDDFDFDDEDEEDDEDEDEEDEDEDELQTDFVDHSETGNSHAVGSRRVKLAETQYNTVNDSWFVNYNGIIVILPIIFNAFQDAKLERSYQRYSHGQRQKSLIIAHTVDLLLKLSFLGLFALSQPQVVGRGLKLISDDLFVGSQQLLELSDRILFGRWWIGTSNASRESELGERQAMIDFVLELARFNYQLLAFALMNLLIISSCVCLPHRYLTNKLSLIALFTWLLMCWQSYKLYSNNNNNNNGQVVGWDSMQETWKEMQTTIAENNKSTNSWLVSEMHVSKVTE